MRYVVGFAFDEHGRVALIRKNKPAWQAGFLNGVGGKIEENEAPKEAMIREFHEEAGAVVVGWELFCVLHDVESKAEVFFYRVRHDLRFVKTTTDEPVEVHHVDRLEREQLLPTVQWMIPMALDPYVGRVPVNVLYGRGEP